MSGFDNDVVFGKNADFTRSDNQNVLETNGLSTNGQLWIGTTSANVGGTHINVGSLSSPLGTLSIGYSSPNITLDVAGSSSGSTIFTKFISSGTWTKNANTKFIEIIAWGGGSGGGSGSKYPISMGSTASSGGGGGSGSGTMYYYGSAAFFGATETVTIGTGGAGGAAITTDDTDGLPGVMGGSTSIGNLFTGSVSQITFGAGGGLSGGGAGGSACVVFTPTDGLCTIAAAGGSGGVGVPNPAQIGVDYPNLSQSVAAFVNGTGGGGGGIDPNTGIGENGKRGGNILTNQDIPSIVLAGGAGGVYAGAVNGSVGLNASTVTSGAMFVGGTGGGGGASSVTGNGGNGGDGGIPGGCGAGGGGSINGAAHDSGSGGSGARGELWVIEYT